MAGPSTVGTLGLDIKEFEEPWHQVLADIAQLEPELKQANAMLKLMERSFRGAGGGAAYSAKQIEAQRKIVKSLTAERKALASEEKAFRQEQEKPSKTGLIGVLAKLSVGAAILNVAHTLATTGRNASELTRGLDELNDIQNRAGSSANAATNSMRGFKGAVLDVIGAVSEIPIVGQAFDVLAAPILNAVRHEKDMIEFGAAMSQSAAGAAELTSKLASLEQQRFKMEKKRDNSFMVRAMQGVGAAIGFAPGLGNLGNKISQAGTKQELETQQAILETEKERKLLIHQIADSLELESKARSSALAGSQRQSELAGIELEYNKKLAESAKLGKDKDGNIIPEALPAVIAMQKQAKSDRALQIQESNRAFDIAKDTVDVQTAGAANALRGSMGQLDNAKKLLELAENTASKHGGAGLEQQQQEASRVALAKVAVRQAEIQLENEMTALRLETQAMDAQRKGMIGVAEQAGIAARFDKEIATHLRAGNKEAAEMVQLQKEIAMQAERAREHDVTPKDRQKAIRDARIERTKAKQEEAREADIRKRAFHEGAGGGLDKGDLDALRRKSPRGERLTGGGALSSGGLNRVDANGKDIGGLNAPIPKSRRVQEQELKDRNQAEGKMQQARAIADQKLFQTQMLNLTKDVAAIQSDISKG